MLSSQYKPEKIKSKRPLSWIFWDTLYRLLVLQTNSWIFLVRNKILMINQIDLPPSLIIHSKPPESFLLFLEFQKGSYLDTPALLFSLFLSLSCTLSHQWSEQLWKRCELFVLCSCPPTSSISWPALPPFLLLSLPSTSPGELSEVYESEGAALIRVEFLRFWVSQVVWKWWLLMGLTGWRWLSWL